MWDHWVANTRLLRAAASVVWLVALLLWETAAPYARLFRTRAERARHGAVNLTLGVVNLVLVALVFSTAWRIVTVRAASAGVGLLNWTGATGWVHAAGALVLLDAWTYAWHRLNHAISFLWRWHGVHHADAAMDVTTANRFHTVEIALSSAARIVVLPLAGVGFGELVVYETALQASNLLQHANIGLPPEIDRWVNALLVTPSMHKVHHSPFRPDTDSNYSSVLSIWDRLLGTYRGCLRAGAPVFGLDGLGRDPSAKTLLGILKLPWAPRRGAREGRD
jgi:sterol desaturase/sphingolipid hydroxylase (fatty acid hydroxylase superfamily)